MLNGRPRPATERAIARHVPTGVSSADGALEPRSRGDRPPGALRITARRRPVEPGGPDACRHIGAM